MMSASAPTARSIRSTRERVDIEINIANLQRLNLFLGMRVENGCGTSKESANQQQKPKFI